MEKENLKSNALQAYDFLQATEADLEALTDFCVAHFSRLEPHNKALGIIGEDVRPVYHFLMAKCLHFPFSVKVIEKSSGEIIAIRTMSVTHRDESLNYEPYELDITNLPEDCKKIEDLVMKTEEWLWDAVDPKVTKMLQREVSLVLPEHCRKGIARHIAELWLDFDQLRKEGFHGICSEALSMPNQKLLFSMGFKCVAVPDYDWKNKLTNGTKTAMALFKDIRA